MWSSVFWVRSFLLMKPLNNLFLIELDFCSAVVILGLVLNLVLYLLSFFNGACLSRIPFMESKKFWKDVLVSLFWSCRIWDQSIAKYSRIKSSQLNLDESRSKMLDLLLEAFEKIRVAIRNCGNWSDMIDTRFPEMVSWEISLEKILRILSITDFEWDVILVGWIL